MDKLWNRFKYYAIGLGFGCLVVYFTFGSRGCSWLPGNRVKNMIGEKKIIVGDSIADIMKCTSLDNYAIYSLLKSDGDVEFSLSETTTKPKIYYIEGELDKKSFFAKFALHENEPLSSEIEEYAEVVALGWSKDNACTSELSNKHKTILPIPHDDVINILESHEFRILDTAECAMEFYGLSEEDVLNFHKTAQVDSENSKPRQSPNPIYIMIGDINGKKYRFVYIIGDNRTRISEIKGSENSGC